MPTSVQCSGITGPIEVYSGGEYEFTAYVEYPAGIEPDEDKVVYLAYFVQELVRGSDFDGPNEITIPKGTYSVKFKMSFSPSIDKKDQNFYMLKIEGTTEDCSVVCQEFSTTIHKREPLECGNMFFFKPYGHSTKKVPNPIDKTKEALWVT